MTDEQTPQVNKTLLLVLAGVVALAALFFLVINPLLLNNDEDPDADVDVTIDTDGDTPDPTATEPEVDVELGEPAEGEPPAETFEIFNARDPFNQLVTENTGQGQADGDNDGDTDGSADGTGDLDGDGLDNLTDNDDDGDGIADADEDNDDGSDVDSDGDGTDDNIDDDDDDDGVDDDDDSDDDGDGVDDDDDTVDDGDDDADVGGTTVTLVEIFNASDGTTRATVSVNGTAYTVDEGDTFARSFRLLDVSGSCATMLFGDNRFTLCEGDSVRK